MPKILIVDDEQRYREEIALALEPLHHEIATAAGGRQAIELGARFRPNVLVADWLLDDHIHGLHVSEVLRVVDPDIRTILITGFSTQDLKAEAGAMHVLDFIEKPFDVAHLERAVQGAIQAKETKHAPFPVGVMELDSGGGIIYANWKARSMFATTRAGVEAANLTDLFGADVSLFHKASVEKWNKITPSTALPTLWHVRSRTWPDGGGLVVFFPEQDEHYRRHPLIRMLLNVLEPVQVCWPYESHVLVVDDFEWIRRVEVAGLERIGAICHAAENGEVALRILERDRKIEFVVLDYDIPGTNIRRLVEGITALCPNVVIVGCTGGSHREEFAALGVDLYLPKPFTIGDLVNVLTGRIGNCVDCGLPIPLRRPRPGEAAESWQCRGCGSHYRAMFDESFPPQVLSNV
ncbi:MAG: response regulator, partial [Phycisphaerae bacterium]|nr:response regulator [Phycisphaerae bacterium]